MTETKQVRLDVPEDLLIAFDDHCELHDVSRSRRIRQLMAGAVNDAEAIDVPADPELAAAYRLIYARTDDRGEGSYDAIVTDVAQQLSISADLVKSSRIAPLKRDGWIVVDSRWFDVRIYVPAKRDGPEAVTP